MRHNIIKQALHQHSHKLFWLIPIVVLFGIGILSSTAFVQEDKVVLALYPEGGTFLKGHNFEVSVHITATQSINAIAAQIVFSPEKFQVVQVSQEDSILKLWIHEAQISNDAGILRIAGGLPNPGFTGEGSVVRILFRARDVGWGSIGFSTAAVLANDGKGTNVLEEMRGGVFYVQDPPESFPDLNGDNRVDLSDLAILIFNWRGTQNLRYDINGDGQVGIRDISILISSLGKTRPQ